MPAEKSARQTARRHLVNRPHRSGARTAVTKARHLIGAGDLNAAEKAVRHAEAALDHAAQKGVLHRNNAARRKSRLWQRFNKASAAEGSQIS